MIQCRKYLRIILAIFMLIRIAKLETNLEHIKAIWSRYAQVSNGLTTYYGEYPVGTGACSLDPISPLNREPGWIKVAAGKYDYQKSLGCGMCIEIKGDGEPATPAHGGTTPVKGTLRATIVDLCGGCEQGGFDLYIRGNGKWKTSFKAIACPTISGQDGNIQFRFSGSNAWSMKLQVRNSKVATAGMEILHSNKWRCMRRTDDNYFTNNGMNLGELKFPIKVRVTSISNEQFESTIKELQNDVNIPTTIQYQGFIADSKPEQIKCYGQGETPGGGGESPSPTEASTTSLNTAAPSTTNASATTLTTERPTTTEASAVTPTTEPLITTTPAPGAESPTTSPLTTVGQTTHIAPLYSDNDREFCKKHGDGLYPEEENRFGFVVCSSGKDYKQNCPSGLMYNAKLKVCDWPRNVYTSF